MRDNHTGKVKQILGVGWEDFVSKHGPVRPAVYQNVVKMMACRTALLGHHLYVCPTCGEAKIVPHSCKSRFCSVCGMVATENWIRHQFGFLLDCPYQHIVVTIPFDFRWMAKRCRNEVLNAITRIAADVIKEWAAERGFEPGMVSFFHSFGENLQFHPHYHMLVTSGGITSDGSWKTEKSAFPALLLMARYRARMMAFFRALIHSGDLKTKKNKVAHLKQMEKSFTAWQFFAQKMTDNEKSLLLYITRYVKRMIMSEKRIVSWNSDDVTFMTKSGKTLVYRLDQFILCITQHIPDKHFRLVRYYGFYANASREKYSQAKAHWKTIQNPIKKSTWQERQWRRLGRDPKTCRRCKTELLLASVSYGKKWIYWTWGQLLQVNEYECPQCHDKEPFQQSEDELLRDMYDIPNDLPIFFECSFCPGAFMKPIGYTFGET